MSLDPEKNPDATEAGAPNLFLCDTCGRHFAPEALARHNPICKKFFNKKRKPFNSLKQRLQGTDIPTVKKKPPVKNERERKSNWRQQHEDFISAIRAAKVATQAMKEGRPLPPPPPPSINPDYIQCPYCMRRFNQTAAERHINFCKEQAARRSSAPVQKGGKSPAGKQGVSKKEPTLTNAVGTLLQNRLQEANTAQCVTGHGIEISVGAVQKKISPLSSGTESGPGYPPATVRFLWKPQNVGPQRTQWTRCSRGQNSYQETSSGYHKVFYSWEQKVANSFRS